MDQHLELQQNRAEEHPLSLLASGMTGLDETDWDALRSIPVLHRFVGRNRPISMEEEHNPCVRILCKGWAIRAVELDYDRRQILDFVLPGDVIGLQSGAGSGATCQVIALTACEIGEMELRDLESAARRYPAINSGLRHILTLQLAQANDQIARLGRMTAYERVCSFLLDIHARQSARNPGERQFDFPITQAIVADALGLSVVHVNRQIMQLRREGLVVLSRRKLHVLHPDRLAEACGLRRRRFESAPEAVLQAAG